MTRRLLLKLTLAGLGTRLVSFDDLIAAVHPASEMQTSEPSITPTDDFYVQSVGKSPKIRKKDWRLFVEGLVDHPKVFTFKEIYDRTQIKRMTTLACIGNQPGGNQVGNAVWTGCSLEELMKSCGLQSDASRLIFECSDIFSSSSTTERLFDSDALLAYAMNNRPLTRDHGFPLRLIVPGKYGMKSPKWIKRIIASDTEHRGYWENFGWSDSADIQILSRIDDRIVNRRIRGIALNGHVPITRVDLSLDDGVTWVETTLHRPSVSCVWTEWSYACGDIKGDITVICRATNERGEVQQFANGNPFPDGASAPDRQKFRIL